MGKMPSFKQIKAYGFDLGQAKHWITNDSKNKLAMDAPVTAANSAVPIELATYFDPKAIEILTGKRAATQIYNEVKKGEWTTPVLKYRTQEVTGTTQPYGDFANTGTSGQNYNWIPRDTYLFQTIIEYGDLEEAVTSLAKINLASDKQIAAANIIDIDANKFYFQGVSGLNVYGLLNDPGLTASLTASTKAAGGTTWAAGTTQENYQDVLTLFKGLVSQMDGLVDKDTPLILGLAPDLAVELGKATLYNVSTQDMLDKYFSNLTIVTAPEYYATATGNTMQMIAKEVLGQQTGELVYHVKVKSGRIVPELSSLKQKWTSGTSGAHILRPAAIKQMRGM